MNRPQRIGFIGLGMMGTSMAECLSNAGYYLLLADADDKRVADLQVRLNAAKVDSENAETLDVLITMLPKSNIVETVLLG